MNVIETERLILRKWKPEDAEEYYQINRDTKVIEFLGRSLSKEQVQEFMDAANRQFDELGYTLWATEEKASGKLIGFIGLAPVKWEAHFTPCIEIAARLGSEYWSKGYASEGGKAVLKYGFEVLGIKEIVSFTVPANTRSRRVMESIGMKRDPSGDFAHPKLAPDHPLSKHVLYRIKVKKN